MAANDALIASLLLGQRQKKDPLEIYQSFGRDQIKAGSSTAPLGSGNALEGIARALQGGIGGLMQGYSMGKQEEQGQNTITGLADILGAKDTADMAERAKNFKGDPAILASILGQSVTQRQTQFQNQDKGNQFEATYRGAPAAPQQATGGGIPQPGYAAATAPGSAIGTADRDKFIQTMTPHALAVAQATGLDPRLVLAQSALETGYGASAPGNNFFGIKSHGAPGGQVLPTTEAGPGGALQPTQDSFRTYSDPAASARDYAEFLKTNGRYQPVLQAQGLDAQIDAMAKAGYATDPNYGSKLRQVAQGIPQMGGAPGQAAPGSPGPVAAGPQIAQGDALPQGAPSAASGPPEIPRPKASDEQIQKYKSLIASGQMTGHQAAQELDKEVTQQWQMDKTRQMEIWKDQQTSKRQNEQAAINLGQKAPMELITKRVDNYETKVRPAAVAAANDIGAIHQVRQILDAGAFTGTGAEAKLALGKLGEFAGIPSDQAQNTQVLGSALAKRVLAGSGGSLGSGFSNADRDFMELAQGGKITLDEGAIRRIMDLGERQARSTLKTHDAEAGRIKNLPGVGQLGDAQFVVEAPPSYAEWSKANPLQPMQGAVKPAQTDIPTIQTPDEARKLPKGTQFKTPDGRLLTVP